MTNLNKNSKLRKKMQLVLWLIVPITILGGLKYPLLGFIVPVVMLTGIIGAIIKKSRYVCGWLCPRGSFFDRVANLVSPHKNIPQWFRNPIFRWSVFAIMISFMVFQIAQNPDDIYHWGQVFVRICIITTGIGIILAVLLHQRAWCSFCPMGTLQAQFSEPEKRLTMGSDCKMCRTCEKSCPINLKIVNNTDEDGRLMSKDCLSCPECQISCPKKILKLP